MLISEIIVGLIAGILGGFFGIGGGLVLVPAFIYFFKLNMQIAVGTSLLAIVPTAVIGAWRHWGYGHIELKTALWVGLFAAIGSLLGAFLTTKISSTLLQKLFALFLLAISLHMFFKK